MPANVTVIAGAAQVDLYLGNYSYANVVASMENLKFKAATDINRIMWKNASGTTYKLMHDASGASNHISGRVLVTDNNGAAETYSALTFDGAILATTGTARASIVQANSQLNMHGTLNILAKDGATYTTVGTRNASGDSAVLDLNNIGTVNLPLLTASRILELDSSKNVVSVVKGTAYNKNFGSSAGDVCEGNDSRIAYLSYSSDKLTVTGSIEATIDYYVGSGKGIYDAGNAKRISFDHSAGKINFNGDIQVSGFVQNTSGGGVALKVKKFSQDDAPSLETDESAFWVDTNDSNKVYLVYSIDGVIVKKVELT